MASLVPGFAYDIFISYRQKDNKHLSAGQAGEGWVTEFVKHLKEELDATFKQDISIYFDANPHDGLGETHHVDKSLAGKLKCLILIPIISRTYCDPQSFAWQQEFLVFRDQAKADSFGLEVRLANQNVASRILPVQIHELSYEDQKLFDRENGGPLRAIPLVFKSQGVNRPLTPSDSRAENSNKTLYRDQINKTANAVEEILGVLIANPQDEPAKQKNKNELRPTSGLRKTPNWFWSELLRRNILRAAFAYLVLALASRQLTGLLASWMGLTDQLIFLASWVLVLFFPVAMTMAWLYEMSPGGFIRIDSQASAGNPYLPSQKKPFTGGLIAVLFILIIVLFFVKPPVSPGKPVPLPQKSIAVIPFENRSENSKDAYLAEALTNEVINRLTVLSDLRVYKTSSRNYDTIAMTLDVLTILTGTVQRIGDTVLITAQLVELPKKNNIWGKTFTRRTRDMMAIRSDVAKRIADVLKIKITEVEQGRLNHRPTENATAYEYYLRGRKLYEHQRNDSNNLAIQKFKDAIALDHEYASAWAGLADAYGQMGPRYGRELFWADSSLAAGKRAVLLDSTLSDAYKGLAHAYASMNRYDTAAILLRKAVEIDPNNAKAVGNLGTDCMLNGDLTEALRWEKKAVWLDRKNPIPYHIVGWIYRWLGDLPQAETWFKKSIELDPNVSIWDNYELLAYCLVGQGRSDEAMELIPTVVSPDSTDSRRLETAGLIAHFAGDKFQAKKYFQRSIDYNPSFKDDLITVSPIGLGQILLEEGNKVEAEMYLARTLEVNLREIQKNTLDDDPAFYVSAIYAIKGNRQESLIYLKKAIEFKWIDYAKFVDGPWFVRYRNDPEFLAIIDGLRKKIEVMRVNTEGL